MPPASAFADLLERVRGGDRAALGDLLSQYEPALRRFARAHLGPALRPYADSVDLVQSAHKSVMIALWSNRYEFSSPEKLLALAKTILQRKVAHLAGHVGRQKRADAGPGGDDSHTGFIQSLPSPDATPAEAAEFTNALDHVGRHLNEHERHILRLLLQGHTRKEVAEALGEDPHAFRVYWSRVMERLSDSGALNAWLGSTVA
jgi:RNA polymerase sigma-70 factor (ECF subfamily)